MEQGEQSLLEPILQEHAMRRKDLLPTWIRIFSWIFLVAGAFVVVAELMALGGSQFTTALYGLQSSEPGSATGLLIGGLFLLKGVVAFGLLKERSWGVPLGIFDAATGVLVCLGVMMGFSFLQNEAGAGIRLELLFLIPYGLYLLKIRQQWRIAGGN